MPQNIHVLYADDVPANRRYIKALLEKVGMQPDIASNGHGALQLWEQTRHPLVLLDVRMPDLDGAEVARRLRLLQKADESLVIIGITASLSETLHYSLQQAGMDDCIEKPTDTQTLLQALEPWLDKDNAQLKTPATGNNLLEDPELLSLLLTELPKDMAALETAFADSQLPRACEIAHQLSGVSALYGLTRLHVAVTNLDQYLKIGAPMSDDMLQPVAEALAEDLAEIQSAQL